MVDVWRIKQQGGKGAVEYMLWPAEGKGARKEKPVTKEAVIAEFPSGKPSDERVTIIAESDGKVTKIKKVQ